MERKKIRLISLFSCLLISPAGFADTSIKFSTWNIEWLTNDPIKSIKSTQREEKDFAALANHFSTMKSDVLAFQEVDSEQAIEKLVGNDYHIYLSDRANRSYQRNQFDDINQYTGFAIDKNIPVLDKPDIKLDKSPGSKLRFGTYVILYPDSDSPIHALSIHLKARCSGKYKNNRHCQTLKQQGIQLNQWILEREQQQQPYIILGDFNHNLAYRNDWLWNDVTEGTQAVLLTESTNASCKVRSNKNPNKTHQFRSLIDHIITSDLLLSHNTVQNSFNTADVLNFQMSDHCPISTDIDTSNLYGK
ncbi:endonuclease/exonuclease/phosphatase family protein [Vibrio sinensis]|uniref:Endonuclease/exonuclease/phosphatase family protein n=1 Tax=Vibrio sinensis TaxID=2302434 RepID=A0A3A6QY26_9VIBR|nr:endonuclease/exonuclease/phosphatase family protein [Vibrio sinensis]RJX75446.1 endonuclease/exonuclease/phosphatase family protein [Vibrio sinensis]